MKKSFLSGIVVLALSALASSNLSAEAVTNIDTSAGKLEYRNLFPTDATAQKVYDELDYQRATQAYINTLPYVAFQAFYEGLVNAGAGKINDIPVFSKMLTADACVFTGNDTTIYGFNSFYLDGEPVVLEIPAGATAGMINNAWQQPFTDMGAVGEEKGAGAKYLILPPDYKGEIPKGYLVRQSDTNKIVWLIRGFTTPEVSEEGVRDILRTTKVYKLEDKDNIPRMNPIDLSEQKLDLCYEAVDGYFDTLTRGMEREQGRIQDKLLTSSLHTLGINVGSKSEAPDERMEMIFRKAAVMGDAMANTMAFSNRRDEALRWDDRKHENAILGLDARMEDEQLIDIDARIIYSYEAASLSQAMVNEWVDRGSKYLITLKDADGKYFDGDNAYRLNVSADVPAGRFWSLTVYDVKTRSMIVNEEGRTALSSLTKGVKERSDGSVDIILSPDAPEGMESNWVQTNRNAGFFTLFRVYSPGKEYYTTWRLNDVEAFAN